MFSINSLDGNSFFDIGLKYRQMQIKELGDESFNAPSELRDTEKSSLSSSGDTSFSKFVGSFDKLHSLITAYVFKRNSNTSGADKEVEGLLEQIYTINSEKAGEKIDASNYDNQELLGAFDQTLLTELKSIEKPDPVNVQKSIDSLLHSEFGDSPPVLYLNAIGHTIETVSEFTQSLTKTKDSMKIKSFNQLIIDLDRKSVV